MKRFSLKLCAVLIGSVLIVSILNVRVITRQGVNYQVREIRVPLYLKLLDFIDRHYNYKNLVVNIAGDAKDSSSKVVKILGWVHANVRKNPQELPVIDDHPLNIIIRGYAVADQFEDIFSILCTYAGQPAFFKMFKNRLGRFYYISFVQIKGRWCPSSAFAGVYSEKSGAIASVEEIFLDKRLLEPFALKLPDFEVDSFLTEIKKMDFNASGGRVKGQSPGGRILYLIRNKIESIF
jgi:hypothetical protein